MISRITGLLKKKEYKTILENMLSLTGLQFASYILPLITLPYLTWILGPELFGLTQYAISLITYFQFFTDYGFNLSATRELAIVKDDKDKVSRIFNSVMFIKVILCIISFVITLLLITFISKFNSDAMIYLLTFGMVIGYILFPTWLFQGMEYMKYTSILNILGKVIFTVLIFLLIHEPEDYILVPIINSLGLIIVGIIGLYLAITKFDIKLKIPSKEDVKYHLKEGWHVFISTIAINMYTTTNTFLLGLLTNNTLVGYYSISEKIILAVNGLLNPISQALYPFISRSVNDDKKTSIIFIRKLTKLMAVVGLVLSIGLLIFSKTIILTLFGPNYASSIILLQIMAMIPLAVSLSTIFGIETMLTFNYKKAFTTIVMLGGLLDVTLGIILICILKEVGIAISFTVTEIFITVAMFLFLQNKGIKIIGKLNNNNKE
ncbi:MAG: transporter [Methanosphaera sp. rholeuAM130]|nr:flippase [Methanosphaera sp.]RAP53834.1 MAG: transporter [Methanosphaera sp. rholeuAM130]